MKIQEGTVIEVIDGIAKVIVKNQNEDLGKSEVILNVKNQIKAKSGQRVALDVKGTGPLKAAFITFLLPLIMIFIGAALGEWIALKYYKDVQTFQIVGGCIGFILSILNVKVFDKNIKTNDKMMPIIIRIIS